MLIEGIAQDMQNAKCGGRLIDHVWILGRIICSWISFFSILVMRVFPKKKNVEKIIIINKN